MDKVTNWGLYPTVEAEVFQSSDYKELSEFVATQDHIIPRGNGRCYGDSSLQKKICSTLSLNKFLHFDTERGILKCESGVLLSEVLEVIVPKGFFLPVTPGTKFVTMGGAVASNIHGKNHHIEGALSLYVTGLDILTETGEIIHCSRSSNADLFVNTIGGMGLTGIILSVSLQLKKIASSYIRQKSIKAKNIHALLDYFESYNDWTYSVAWIDCLSKGDQLGRSILMVGEHAELDELKPSEAGDPLMVHKKNQINVPFTLPSFSLNKYSIKAFNFLYYNKQFKKMADTVIHYNPFFYPLDVLDNWNRIYGKNGFVQYQFVIPFKNGKEGLVKILEKIAEAGAGSFLAVLKTMGEGDRFSAPISFPTSGYTLALDFKANKKTFELLSVLDEMVIDFGGRIYLTKDARMDKKVFEKTYHDPFTHGEKFSSIQSNRLCI